MPFSKKQYVFRPLDLLLYMAESAYFKMSSVLELFSSKIAMPMLAVMWYMLLQT